MSCVGRVFGFREDGSLENDFIVAASCFRPDPDEAESLPRPFCPPERHE